KAIVELIPIHCFQLTLGVVNIVDIYGLETEILQASIELIFEVSRSHAVTARGNLFGAGKTLLYYILDDPGSRIARRFVFKRKEPRLRRHHDLIARGFACSTHLFKRT